MKWERWKKLEKRSFGFGKKIDSDTDTEIGPWFGFGCTLAGS